MEQRISLVTLGVADLARARAFYEALGWRGGQQPDAEVCFYQAGGMVFGLWSALGAPSSGRRCWPSGAARPERSPTPTATSGRWRTTPPGPSMTTARSVSDHNRGDRHDD